MLMTFVPYTSFDLTFFRYVFIDTHTLLLLSINSSLCLIFFMINNFLYTNFRFQIQYYVVALFFFLLFI